MKTIKFSDFMAKTHKFEGLTAKELTFYEEFVNLAFGLLIAVLLLKFAPIALLNFAPISGVQTAFLQF